MIYLAFNEREALDWVSSSDNVVSTGSDFVALSGINRAGVHCRARAQATAPLNTGISEGWARVRIRGRANSTTALNEPAFSLRRSSDNEPIAEIRQQSGNNNFYARSPLDGGDVFLGESGTYDFDIHFNIAEEGFVRFYVDHILLHQVSGDTRFGSGTEEVDQIFIRATGLNNTAATYSNYFSHIIVSDEPTIGARVYTLPLTEGTTNQWSDNVSDVTGTDFAGVDDYLLSDTADQTVTFTATMPAIDTGAGQYISAFLLSSQAFADDTAPADKMEFVFDDTPSGDISGAIGTAPEYVVLNLDENPDTELPWTSSDISNNEFGVISRA